MRSQVFSLLVDNNPGVLSRIAGLFSRRGYSIDSIHGILEKLCRLIIIRNNTFAVAGAVFGNMCHSLLNAVHKDYSSCIGG